IGSGVETVATIDELIAGKPDAAFVLTPDWRHERDAVRLLEAGIAVYLEKPMAISTEACDRILAAAARSGARLYVGHNMRHMAFVREMKRLVDAGAIGQVKTVWARHFVGHGGDFFFRDWHADRRKTTGLLLQKGAHDIDVIHWLAGGYSQTVHAFGTLAVYGETADRRAGGESWWKTGRLDAWPPRSIRPLNDVVDVEDLSLMQMTLDNGVLASYLQCNFTPDYWRSYTVVGDEGRLENFGDGDEGTVIKVWNRRKRGFAEADVTLPIQVAIGGHGGADALIVAEFIRFVRDGGATETSPIAARYAVAAADAATESLRHGGIPADVPPLKD
ncbi:MAG TPA: Gfo/Idh/MocA family oxidoreductase, partial [Candidatus Dormibacteraeota bacterium]|nr:Gfo/Idh/MocA family oxidoreductase [Candidatus Dormibacteraeota bacterium]